MTDEALGVAVVADTFPSTSETFVSAQVLGLRARGHRVAVLAERRPYCEEPVAGQLAAWALTDRVSYADLPPDVEAGLGVMPLLALTWPPGATRPVRNYRRVLAAAPSLTRVTLQSPALARELLSPEHYGVDAKSLAVVRRAAAAQRIGTSVDVAHIHFGPVGLSYRFLARLWRVPVVVTFHGYDFSSWPARQGNDVYRPLYDLAAAVTVNCQHARQRLLALGWPEHRVHQLNIGVDLGRCEFRVRARQRDEPLRLLTVGRLTEKKGYPTALRAVARLVATGAAVRYDIVGGGPMQEELSRLIHGLGLRGVVRLHGAQPAIAVHRFLRQAHVFVLASQTAADGDQEGTPVVLLEAQACGLPVVSTRHSGIPEIVLDGLTGRLAPERDPEALAAALLDLAARSDGWPEMGRRGRAHVAQHHDANALLSDLVALYRRVGAGDRARRQREWLPRARRTPVDVIAPGA